MRTVIIVQARMTSTRLPGKVLKQVMGKPLLEYQIERLRRIKFANEIVIATTVNDTDLPIIQVCEKLNVVCYRGSENDVLARYYEAARENGADVVVRITSDCPVIDPLIIDEVIRFYRESYPKYDYVSNSLKRTFPRGMDTEVFSFKALEEAFKAATALPDREHVTPYIYRHPEQYSLGNIENIEDESRHRWTVDTEEDFLLISQIIKAIYPVNPSFNMRDCLELINQNPEWFNINSHVEQKTYGQ